MDIDIRSHIINNFKNDDEQEIKNAIEAGIESKEEVALPGLGVFLELAWNNSDDEFKKAILTNIKKGL